MKTAIVMILFALLSPCIVAGFLWELVATMFLLGRELAKEIT